MSEKNPSLFHKPIPIETPVIDSLSLNIPYLECDILDKKLINESQLYYFEIDERGCEIFPPKPIKITTTEGISVSFGLMKVAGFNKKTGEKIQRKYIRFTLSSKLLKTNYFEGINATNIHLLYQQFLSFKIVSCSFETFLNSHCNDVDICMNVYVENINIYTSLINILYSDAGEKQHLLNPIKKVSEMNVGMSFNKREKAKPSLPYYKMYHKEYELKTKSESFYKAYLSPFYDKEIINLTRVEATIKNSAHKTYLERKKTLPNFKTLQELLNIKQNKLFNFLVTSLKCYIEKRFIEKRTDLTPTDHLLSEFIYFSVQKGASLSLMDSFCDSYAMNSPTVTDLARKKAIKRLKTKIKELSNSVLNFEDGSIQKLKKNEQTRAYLFKIGLKS